MFGSTMFGAGLFGGAECCCGVVPPTPGPEGASGGVYGKRPRFWLDDEYRDEDDVALALALLDL